MFSCLLGCWRSPRVEPSDSTNHVRIRSSETTKVFVYQSRPVQQSINDEISSRSETITLTIDSSNGNTVNAIEKLNDKKIVVKQSRLKNLDGNIFDLVCGYLSYQDLSQLILVSKEHQSRIQAGLLRNPVPFLDSDSIAKADEQSKELLDEIEANFDITADPILQSKVDEINKLKQPLRHLHLQILAVQRCIKWSSFRPLEIDRVINACITIPSKRKALRRILQSWSYVNDGNIFTAIIWGCGKAYEEAKNDIENNRKTIVLTKTLLDMGFQLNHGENNRSYTFINVCFNANATNHLRLLIERGASLHSQGYVLSTSVTPLMEICGLTMSEKTLTTLLEYLPDPFRQTRILYDGQEQLLSTEEYISARFRGRYFSGLHIFETYKAHYIEIKNTMDRLLSPPITELALSYIRL